MRETESLLIFSLADVFNTSRVGELFLKINIEFVNVQSIGKCLLLSYNLKRQKMSPYPSIVGKKKMSLCLQKG